MEGKGPYRIYDPGGATREEAAKAFERLVEENTQLKEKMQGIKSLGELLEESHVEASKLRQKVEDLVKDNKMLQPSPFPSDELLEVTGRDSDGNVTSTLQGEKEQDAETRPTPLSGSSSEFEIVTAEDKRFSHESRKSDTEKPQHEDANLMLHLQRLESTLSVFAEEADRNQVLAHLGRMALEFNRLASKVHRNEQRTSVLQTLCEQLRNENEDLRAKLEKDLEQRNQVTEKLRCENQELRKMVLLRKEGAKGDSVELCSPQQSGATAEKASGKGTSEASEKKVKILEHQRNELLEVNKQWDQHFRAMKQQYEQKITDLRHKLADAQKALGEQEVEREQKQRDFDRKLLLAKSRIEVEEAEKERLSAEAKELKRRTQFLQEQLAPVTKQREYQEKEIQRLNKALEEALSSQATAPAASAFVSTAEPGGGMHRHELLTQNELLKQQVKVFEEDFQRERRDRERMNEEKEELKQQLVKLQKQLTVSSHQLRLCKDDCQREKEEKEKLKKVLKQHKQQLSGERIPPEPLPAPLGPTCPVYQFQYSPPVPHPLFHGYEDWQQIRYPPPAEHSPIQNFRHFPPPEYAWRLPPCTASRIQNPPAVDGVKPSAKDAEPAGSGGPKSPRPV